MLSGTNDVSFAKDTIKYRLFLVCACKMDTYGDVQCALSEERLGRSECLVYFHFCRKSVARSPSSDWHLELPTKSSVSFTESRCFYPVLAEQDCTSTTLDSLRTRNQRLQTGDLLQFRRSPLRKR